MDNKVLMDLARQLGLPEESAEAKAKEYMGKSDEEILREIKKIKTVIKRDKKTYAKQMQTLKALAATMNGQQKARLQKIIELLES
ncbi:hypothetical protein NE619_10325 [Anaerovorax odorimutans]|uniref:Uncharacterized protein n=1 Tax=Anaerovorax odorimutans TaxID=109327 RepID=A0ABT1RPL0_9FIRM|nr:hypothetical protein [Anaerovorax odorimutans]MCQ4637122.1 hypothetical protein [Anaerovorax odorimutans]